MIKINLAFARSSLFLVCFSSTGRDGLARAVNEDAYTVHVDEAWIPLDIDTTFSVIKSVKNSSTTFSTMLNSS
jgi:hypothetical protein